jgi:hypothetical protein
LRASSVLALVLCLLAQLAGSVHSATVRHVACREHGGVVELHGHASPSRNVSHAAVVGTEEASHHAHCDRCATATAKIAARVPGASAGVVPASACLPPATNLLGEPIARLHLAPKGSPPPLSTI